MKRGVHEGAELVLEKKRIAGRRLEVYQSGSRVLYLVESSTYMSSDSSVASIYDTSIKMNAMQICPLASNYSLISSAVGRSTALYSRISAE